MLSNFFLSEEAETGLNEVLPLYLHPITFVSKH